MLALMLLAGGAQAADRDRELCARAAAASEAAERLPPRLLQAMAAVESGRWPWAVRAGGRAYLLDSQAEAVALVERLRRSGLQDIIVGCLQINLRYHAGGFDDIEEALEPSANAAYAAALLNRLYAGSWWEAVARYQGGTPSARQAYIDKVATVWQGTRATAATRAKAAPVLLVDAPFEPGIAGVLDLTAFRNLRFTPRSPGRGAHLARARPDLI